MGITARTKYTPEAFRALCGINSLGKRRRTGSTALAVMFIVMAVLSAGLFFFDRNFRPVIGCSAVFLLTAALLLFNRYGAPHVMYRRAQKNGLPDIEYTFSSDSVIAVTSGEGLSGTVQLDYSRLYRAVETKGYFFLFADAAQVMILDKSGIVNGTAEDIRDRLARAMGKKFCYIKKAI